MAEQVTELWVYVIEDDNGRERVLCHLDSAVGPVPMVATEPELAALRVLAREVAEHAPRPVELRRFVSVEVVEVVEPRG